MGLLKPILFIASLMLFVSCEVVVATISGQKPKIETVNENTAKVNGVLGKRFYKKLIKFHEEQPEVKNLILQDMPGSMNDEWNVKSCQFIHDSCFNTIVTDSSVIASGAVDLFISGNNRKVTPGAKIGVHSWRDLRKDGTDYPRDAEEHDLFIDFFDRIDMDTSFYWYTLLAAPGDSIHWMTEDEIGHYGLRKNADSTSTCFPL